MFVCVWGCFIIVMWVYCLGVEKVKCMFFIGDKILGCEVVEMGLILKVVFLSEFDNEVELLVECMVFVFIN